MRAAIVLLVILVAAPARADDRAAELAKAAAALAQAGDYLGAAARFKEALALDPRAAYACNVGIAYWKARDLPRAQLFLATCSTRASDLEPSFVAQVRGVLDEVEQLLRAGEFAPVDVTVSPEAAVVMVSSFAPDDIFVGSRIVWLPFGEHDLTATAPGHDAAKVHVSIADRSAKAAHLDLATTPPPAPPPPRIVTVAPPRVVHPSRWPWLLGGAASAGAVVLDVTLYRNANALAEQAGQHMPGAEYDAAAARARSWRDAAYVAYGLTGACALATAYLWWRARPRVIPTVTGEGVAIAGAW